MGREPEPLDETRAPGRREALIDFSGDGTDVIDPQTGEVTKAVLFVATLGASSYTYVEPVLRQDLPTWTQCHLNAMCFFGGVTELWVPDNLKAAVTKPDRYEPELNPTCRDLAEHFRVATIPSRVRKPKDKAKVEAAVQVAERWIIAALRRHHFVARAAVRPLVDRLNAKVTRRVKKSRCQLFEELDARARRPLPTREWEYADWAKKTVGFDYHVDFLGHFYSAPYALAHAATEVRATATTVDLLVKGIRVASYTTDTAHTLKEHRDVAERVGCAADHRLNEEGRPRAGARRRWAVARWGLGGCARAAARAC